MKFLKDHLGTTCTLPFVNSVHGFKFMQPYLLNKSTPAEYHMASRIAKAMNHNDKDRS